MTEKEFIFNSFVIDTVLNGTGKELKLYEIDNNPNDGLDDSNLFYVYSTSDENIELIVDKLNEQQEQIQEQKRQIKGFILLKDGLIDDCMKLSEENEQLKQQLKTKVVVNRQYEELQKLKKENEQLKQQIKELYNFVKCDVDNEIDVYPKSILEHLVNILKIIGDVE